MELLKKETFSSAAMGFTAPFVSSCGEMQTKQSQTISQLRRRLVSQAKIYNLSEAHDLIALVTTFTGLCGASKTIPGLPVPGMTSVHNNKMSFQFSTQPDLTYFCVYSKLPKQAAWPNKLKYSQVDTDKAAAALAKHPVSDSLVR
jgi:hypothetical protein